MTLASELRVLGTQSSEKEADLFSVLQTLGISLDKRQKYLVSPCGFKSCFSVPNRISLPPELLIDEVLHGATVSFAWLSLQIPHPIGSGGKALSNV